MSVTDKLTIIRGSSDQIILAKRIARDQVTGKVTILARPDARFFSVRQVQVDGIDAIVAVLTDLEADTRAAVIRDEPKAASTGSVLRDALRARMRRLTQSHDAGSRLSLTLWSRRVMSIRSIGTKRWSSVCLCFRLS